MKDGKPTIAGESSVKSRSRELIDANEPSKCRILRLPDSLVAMRVLVNSVLGHLKYLDRFLPRY